MDDSNLTLLHKGSLKDILKIVTDFNEKNAQVFTFPDLDIKKKKSLVSSLMKWLEDPEQEKCHIACLETLRILSRDKTGLEEVFNKEVLDSLGRLAGLIIQEEEIILEGFKKEKSGVILEAQKTLCNLIYNSPVVQRICSSNGCVEGIMLRLKLYGDPSLSHEIKFFDMRMLFLLTALCADIRPKLRTNFHGITYLREILDLILKLNEEQSLMEHHQKKKKKKNRMSRGSRRGRTTNNQNEDILYPIPCLDDNEVDLAAEVLKVLYNLTVNVDKFNVDEEDEIHFVRLVGILHDILLCDTDSKEKKDELRGQAVHLLSNMPRSTYDELLTEIPPNRSDNRELEFDGMNVEAVQALVGYLEKRLDNAIEFINSISTHTWKKQTPIKDQTQNLTPILVCLGECARGNRTVRRFLRSKVLPPLKDVMNRPEEGTELRNKLVRLMTSPITDVKNLVADFLFVLCKEKVGRLIKYTGYGNAAGLLANRGLMLGGRGQGNYSSDSEDSETEEYSRYKDKINPVLGCYEEPKPDPMQGMTEEQKEYEAMQLVNMMDKLSRGGVVQPMRVGDDGKPHPVDHILEFQEGMGLPMDKDFTESESD